jgi:hypothetical protein
MADKKVERNVRSSEQERPSTPTQKMTGALSDSGTVNIAAADRDKGKSALFDRFRDREERYRREQSSAALSEEATAEVIPTVPDDQDSSEEEEASVDESPV